MSMSKKEKAEYMREYRSKKKVGEPPAVATHQPPVQPSSPSLSPGQSPMAGASKASVEAFLAASASKPNPNPVTTQTPIKPSSPKGVTMGIAAMPIPPDIFKFGDATLRKVFKKEIAEDVAEGGIAPDPIDSDQAAALAEGCNEMLEYYKVKFNPAYGFGLMVFFWILPYLLMIPRKLDKDKKKDDKDDRAGFGLRKHEPAPATAGGTSPTGGTTPVPAPEPKPTTAADLLGAHDHRGTAGDGKNNPGGSNVSDTLVDKRGSVLIPEHPV